MKGLARALASAAFLAAVPVTAAPFQFKKATPNNTHIAEPIGLFTDLTLNRDSCMSTKFGTRQFWICRDTQLIVDGIPELQVVSSTASWTKYALDGSPLISTLPDGSTGVLANGNNNKIPYFARPDSDCNTNTAGLCDDGTRFPAWPDSPPMVVSGQDAGVITAYSFVRRSRIRGDFSTDDPDPVTALYKITYNPVLELIDENALPGIEIVNENFWSQNSIPFGVYGHVVKDGVAYLWGQPSNRKIALAKVPAGSIEDITQYQYWVNGAWTNLAPAINDLGAVIENGSAGGQGTYYYSDLWQSYVWIGQSGIGVSPDFFITTAPDPTGPWETPVSFYMGEPGSADLSAYTLQAHPDLVPAGRDEMYISYTKADHDDAIPHTDIYSTPMVKITWEKKNKLGLLGASRAFVGGS